MGGGGEGGEYLDQAGSTGSECKPRRSGATYHVRRSSVPPAPATAANGHRHRRRTGRARSPAPAGRHRGQSGDVAGQRSVAHGAAPVEQVDAREGILVRRVPAAQLQTRLPGRESAPPPGSPPPPPAPRGCPGVHMGRVAGDLRPVHQVHVEAGAEDHRVEPSVPAGVATCTPPGCGRTSSHGDPAAGRSPRGRRSGAPSPRAVAPARRRCRCRAPLARIVQRFVAAKEAGEGRPLALVHLRQEGTGRTGPPAPRPPAHRRRCRRRRRRRPARRPAGPPTRRNRWHRPNGTRGRQRAGRRAAARETPASAAPRFAAQGQHQLARPVSVPRRTAGARAAGRPHRRPPPATRRCPPAGPRCRAPTAGSRASRCGRSCAAPPSRRRRAGPRTRRGR